MELPDTQYYVFTTYDDGAWLISKETYHSILERQALFCETRCDEVIHFANSVGTRIAIRVSLISALTITTPESRAAGREIRAAMRAEEPDWYQDGE